MRKEPRAPPCGNSLISELLCIQIKKSSITFWDIFNVKLNKSTHQLSWKAKAVKDTEKNDKWYYIPDADSGSNGVSYSTPIQALLHKNSTDSTAFLSWIKKISILTVRSCKQMNSQT